MKFTLSDASLPLYATATLAMLGGAICGALGAVPYHVSQKGRAFQPGELTIRHGEAVQFINDDGDLIHHAYLESAQFSFDSGDQQPGSRTDITFPVTGTFTVLCGIHPKMKLVVRVN